MLIQELAKLTGVPAKTIRYYESIGLLPEPPRAENNYRQYTPAGAERLRFIASARALGLSLSAIEEMLRARDQGTLQCRGVLDSLDEHLVEVDRRIAGLQTMRETLLRIRLEAEKLPPEKLCDDRCVGNLVE